jgi:putative ABC transport system permease protein
MTLWQDIRYGVRTLSRARGMTLVAVLTLALGIGANTAIFSLINAVLLRPLPYGAPDRLVNVHDFFRGGTGPVSGHEFAAWRDQNVVFDNVAAYLYNRFNVTGGRDPEAVAALLVSANYFDVLGVTAAHGRAFRQGEDRAGSNRVVILGSRLWQRRFNSDPAVVGTTISLDNQPHEVVGVMAPRGDLDPDLWVPFDVPLEVRRVGRHGMFVIARLKQGVTIERARADLAAISRRLEEQMPVINAGHGVRVERTYDDVVGGVRWPLMIALGAVGFVLLIACANVGHLLMTRAVARQQEMAVRAALGASRVRLVRTLMAESLIVSLVGGAAGLLLAAWIVDLLPAVTSIAVPRIEDMTIDRRVLAVSAALSILTGVLSGLLPAIKSSRASAVIRVSSAQRTAGVPGGRFGAALVVSEVGLVVILLVGAGLMAQSFVRLLTVHPGFTAGNVLTMSLQLPGSRYSRPPQVIATYEAMLERIRALPEVRSAGGTSVLPLVGAENRGPFSIVGRPDPTPDRVPRASMRSVTADYFRALEIPLLRGRFFSEMDARLAVPVIRWFEQQAFPPGFAEPQAAPVAIINDTMARQFWPDEDPLGKQIGIIFSPPITIVGVVGNVHHGGLKVSPPPEIYLPHVQEPSSTLWVTVRTTGDPTRVAAAIRTEIRAIDADLPVGQMKTMEQVVSDSVARPRFDAGILGVFGAVALFLSMIGIYSVMSYSVGQRTHEIGIRAALGASPRDVLTLVLGQAFVLAAIGVVVGLCGAFGMTRLLETLLFGIEPTDPRTFAVVSILATAVALLASYLPARRAVRVDPLVALKAE